MIRAFVGAGGKTTLIHEQAARYRAQGKRVFVTTSTHMFIEPDTVLSDDSEVILAQLNRTGYVMAGIPEGEKIRSLSSETYERVCSYADVVLLEADGSSRKPIKFPNSTEPVLYDNVEEIVVVCGLQPRFRFLLLVNCSFETSSLNNVCLVVICYQDARITESFTYYFIMLKNQFMAI